MFKCQNKLSLRNRMKSRRRSSLKSLFRCRVRFLMSDLNPQLPLISISDIQRLWLYIQNLFNIWTANYAGGQTIFSRAFWNICCRDSSAHTKEIRQLLVFQKESIAPPSNYPLFQLVFFFDHSSKTPRSYTQECFLIFGREVKKKNNF